KYYLIKANVHRYLWKNTFCVIIPYLIIAILFKSFFPIIMLMGFYFVLYVICAAIAEKIPNRPVAIIDCARRTLTIFRYPRATFIQTNNKITRIDLDKITGISTCWCWRVENGNYAIPGYSYLSGYAGWRALTLEFLDENGVKRREMFFIGIAPLGFTVFSTKSVIARCRKLYS
ncbi:MAG: hypothetical protein RR060_08490, partial [Victivallaceae bacterium]